MDSPCGPKPTTRSLRQTHRQRRRQFECIGKKLKPRGRFHPRHTTSDVLYKVDISTLKKHDDVKEFELNDIGCIRLRTSSPIFFDIYSKNRTTGSFILVDEQTNNTVAAGMIIRALGDGTEEDTGAAIYRVLVEMPGCYSEHPAFSYPKGRR